MNWQKNLPKRWLSWLGAAIGKKALCIALSGGSTPELLYSPFSERHSQIQWTGQMFIFSGAMKVAFPPDNPESNFGMHDRTLFKGMSIPESNMHRIQGENEPEARRPLLREIAELTGKRGTGLPVI